MRNFLELERKERRKKERREEKKRNKISTRNLRRREVEALGDKNDPNIKNR